MKEFWKRFRSNRGAVIGLVILAVVIATAVTAPFLFPTSPWKMVQRPFLPPFTQDGLPLGTDAVGRNVLAGLAHGAYVSLLVGLVSTIVALAIGVPVGALAGYFVGRTDDVLMRFTEFFQTIPSFALAIVLLAIFQPSLTFVIIAIAIVSWPPVARLVRGEVLSLRTREFVEAATLSGLGNTQIILRHILPNAMAPVLVTTRFSSISIFGRVDGSDPVAITIFFAFSVFCLPSSPSGTSCMHCPRTYWLNSSQFGTGPHPLGWPYCCSS